MEGRTIARPDLIISPNRTSTAAVLQWRAGQLPGQTAPQAATAKLFMSLQWRAGQLPGQTTALRVLSLGGGVPSMEGRTIARPDEDSS